MWSGAFWSNIRCNNGNMCQSYEERPPYLWEEGSDASKGKCIGEAMRVLNRMLRLDSLGEGQRVDLTYVREVLRNVEATMAMDVEEREVSAIINNDELDGSTQAFLLAFSRRVGKMKKLKDVGNAVRMGIRMRRRMLAGGLGTASSSKAGATALFVPGVEHIRGLDTWNGFDVFQVARETGGRPLQPIGWGVLERRRLVETFHLPKAQLQAFLAEIEKAYLDPAYHNSIHAADVTQSVHMLLRNGMERGLSDLEILAVVLAAICHDAGHPGETNDFRVKSGDDDAVTYNDRSVNENMHLAISYRILQRKECNFVRDALSPKQRESLRKMVIESVLGTDMAYHFSKLNSLKATIEEKGRDIGKWESTALVLEATLHGADLSNTTKPHDVARQWTDRVLEEFFCQGDQERRLGREISPLCDRYQVSKPGAQVGFINFIVRPLFQALTPLCDTSDMLKNVERYHQYWADELAAEKKRLALPSTPSSRSGSRRTSVPPQRYSVRKE